VGILGTLCNLYAGLFSLLGSRVWSRNSRIKSIARALHLKRKSVGLRSNTSQYLMNLSPLGVRKSSVLQFVGYVSD